MTTWQALLVALLYLVPTSRFGYSFSHIGKQPLCLSIIIGLIMGDVPTAVMMGATLSLIYMGLIPAGSNIPADEALAGVIAIPIAISTGMSPEMAVALAVPVGVLGVFLDQIRRTVNSVWVHMADRHAEHADTAGIMRAAWLWPLLFQVPLRVLPVFFALLYGPNAVSAFMEAVPKWLIHAFEVTGGMLPALGFAITIMVIGKRNLLPYFIAGFFLMQYTKIPIIAAAIFGACLAFLHVQFTTSKEGANA